MTFDELLALIAEVADLHLQGVGPNTPLTDAGLDSLGLVLLLLHVEEQGVPLPDELVESWTTLGDLHHQIDRWYAAGRPDDRVEPPPPVRPADPLDVLQVEGRHVAVAPVQPDHVPVLHHLAGTSRNAVSWWPRGRTVSLGEFEERLWHDAVLQQVVIDRRSRELLGLVRIADYHERDGHAQLMVLGSPHVRSWLAEGVALTVFRAFTMWPLRKLYLLVPAFNDGLIRNRSELLAHEGTFVAHEYFDGRYHDLHVYALYREQFFERWDLLQGRVRAR
ncbi:GNAT family N-acetyltransferase [Aquihabitans sp. McL0605]|uniref:GNAT family N-acetyltransferase n=1 Tax=Aquihabitans sp. McL0605 TaxID=3415671 RepID=UPI003CF2A471